jgi:hypothetical protein
MESTCLTEQTSEDIALSLGSIEATHEVDKIMEGSRRLAGEHGGQRPLTGGFDFGYSRHVEVFREPGLEWKSAGNTRKKTVDGPHAEASDFPRKALQQGATPSGIELFQKRLAPEIGKLFWILRGLREALKNSGKEFAGGFAGKCQSSDFAGVHTLIEKLDHSGGERVGLAASGVCNESLVSHFLPFKKSMVSGAKQFSGFPFKKRAQNGSSHEVFKGWGGQKTPR